MSSANDSDCTGSFISTFCQFALIYNEKKLNILIQHRIRQQAMHVTQHHVRNCIRLEISTGGREHDQMTHISHVIE